MKQINITNFNIFEQTIAAILKLIPQAKLSFGPTGMSINVKVDNQYRAIVFSNSADCKEDISFCFNNLAAFYNILKLIKADHKKTTPEIEMGFDNTFLHIKCKNLKTRLITVKEETIQANVAKAVDMVLTPVLEFKTSSDLIKTIMGNSFIFANKDESRVYLNQHPDLQKNTIYAEVTNKNAKLANVITTKLGDITLGSLDHDLIIDFKRLEIINLFKSDDITIQLMDKPVLVTNLSLVDKEYFSKFTIYVLLRKN